MEPQKNNWKNWNWKGRQLLTFVKGRLSISYTVCVLDIPPFRTSKKALHDSKSRLFSP